MWAEISARAENPDVITTLLVNLTDNYERNCHKFFVWKNLKRMQR